MLTWIDREPVLHMPLKLLMNALEQGHTRLDRDVFFDRPELDP